MPAARHSAIAPGTDRRRGSAKSCQAEEAATEGAWIFGQSADRGRVRNRENPHAGFGKLVHIAQQRIPRRPVHAAQLRDRLRCAFDSHRQRAGCRRLPHLGHGEQIGSQAVDTQQDAGIRGLQGAAREVAESLIHRIIGVRCACQGRHLGQRTEGSRQRSGGLGRYGRSVCAQRRHGHAVLGQRAGLVGAQNGRFAQRLDRSRTAGQDTRPGQAPCPHDHEHGQY